MARETLKDFLRLRTSSTEDRIAYTIDQDGLVKDKDDLGIDPGTGRDLISESGLLGDFVKYLNDLNNHDFKVTGGNQIAPSSDRGEPLAILSPTSGEAFIYTNESGPGTLGSVMASYSNGNLGKASVERVLSKDGSNLNKSGEKTHKLLSSIPSSAADTSGKTFAGPVSAGGNEALKQTVEKLSDNRFKNQYSAAGEKAFAPQDAGLDVSSFEDGTRDSGTYRSQSKLGEYSKDGDGGKTVDLDQLKSIAGQILMSSKNANYAAETWAAAVESGAGAGSLKVDPESISAGGSGAGSEAGIDFSTIDFLTANLDESKYTKSWGTVYTPENMFSQGLSPTNNLLASAAIVAIMKLSSSTLSSVAAGVDSKVNLGRGPFLPGQATYIAKKAQYSHLRNLVLVPTVNSYEKCVEQGYLVLFGTSTNKNTITNSQSIYESGGFWISVARSILKSFAEISVMTDAERFRSGMTKGMVGVFAAISKSSILKFTNAMATIGDVSITSQGKSGEPNPNTPVGPWNVDRLPDGPATRVSKSRSQDGQTASSLAWRGNAVPSMFQIPRNVILAAANMGNLGFGQNPLKGHVGSKLVKDTYIDVKAEGQDARIPNDIVERMENQLDAEYVPFYFHDLRTNEIVAFHAFLENLSDTYSPRWIESNGLGRIDAVQTYKSTSRTLRLSFYVAATSKEDFDEMWFKINKLTTLVYPQWTRGTKVSTKVEYEGKQADSTFIQPFSQVLGASPVIRMRVGDVVKSNYSKFNLARIFGVGTAGITPLAPKEKPGPWDLGAKMAKIEASLTETQLETVFNALYGSPMAIFGEMGMKDRLARALVSQILPNGFANPLGALLIMRELQSPDVAVNLAKMNITAGGLVEAAASGLRNSAQDILGYTVLSFPFLKASMAKGYIKDTDGKRWRLTRPVRTIVMGRDQVTLTDAKGSSSNHDPAYKGPQNRGSTKIKTMYTVAILDLNAPASLFGRKFVVTHEDLMPNPNALFNTYVLPALNIMTVVTTLAQGIANEAATLSGIPADELRISTPDAAMFMDEENNPISKAFASTAGRGLGGVITNLSYEMLDGTNTWEVDWNSRAPISVKVTMAFTAIHDIPPGLDYSGYNRAPIYNVGDIMKNVAGDPYRDDGQASKDYFTAQGRFGMQPDDPSDD